MERTGGLYGLEEMAVVAQLGTAQKEEDNSLDYRVVAWMERNTQESPNIG